MFQLRLNSFSILLILLNGFSNVCAFFVPDIEIEAFTPKGLRISTPDVSGIVYFEVSGKINNKDSTKFSRKILQANNGAWTYFNPDVQLKVGDVVQYSFSIKNGKVLYRDEDLSWTVTALKCEDSSTTVDGKEVCKGTVIFEDDFNRLDKSKWIIENYIPNSGPSYEFNTYENGRDTVGVVKKNLKITPILRKRQSDLYGELDFKKKCSSEISEDCYQRSGSGKMLPPVKSGKIRSKFSFMYGRVDVKAKLPKGDWIFPDISLVPVDKSSTDLKLAVAYSRGNAKFNGNDGVETGGTVLFGGVMVSPKEPKRSLLLRSIKNSETYSSKMHIYSLIWKPGVITTLIDNVEYGRISSSDENINLGPFDTEFYVSIGVGVGGITDFPDNYKSGSYVKPWHDDDVDRMKSFYEAKNQWLPTWEGDEDLLVDYVRITAI